MISVKSDEKPFCKDCKEVQREDPFLLCKSHYNEFYAEYMAWLKGTDYDQDFELDKTNQAVREEDRGEPERKD